MTYTEIDKCRICGNPNLVPILSLGDQYLGGVFPKKKDHLDSLIHGPLDLVKCHTGDRGDKEVCHLLQLRQTYPLAEMYGANYGYRSGLNRSMVMHLSRVAADITRRVKLRADDYVLDIGSNDGTLLRTYPHPRINLVGFDPTGEKFRKYYPDHITLIPEFFSAGLWRERFGDCRAKIITSIAMFYDLEDPMLFMREVYEILADDGVWVLEQSYMPDMLRNSAYDTICHEHLEYYGLRQLKWMADRIGFNFLAIDANNINGGSETVTLTKSHTQISSYLSMHERLMMETGCDTLGPYLTFVERVVRSTGMLLEFIRSARSAGARACGIGASTKGNTLLQYCGLGSDDIACIGEVNADKFGCFTPGTRIPIIPEEEMLATKPDYCLVFPWHYREFFEADPSYAGLDLVFPLPRVSVRSGR